MGNANVLQLEITLEGSDPRIWRRIRIADSVSLADLHQMIQIVMGWTNSHLHQFEIDGGRYTEFDEDFATGAQDSRTTTLRGLDLDRPGKEFVYQYDFGDSWYHRIVVESVEPASSEGAAPVCLAGERACPPEDCGGVPGYERLIKAIGGARFPGAEELLAWVDSDFDPEAFDTPGVNHGLRQWWKSAPR